jgi:hypothetical protein
MKITVKNRFHMLKVVHDTCSESLVAIDSIPACKAAYLRLKGIIEKMEGSMQLQITDHKGLTKEKNYLKHVLAEITVNVSAGLMSYAHIEHDYSLEEEVRCSLSKLFKLADDVMVERSKFIYTKANDIIGELADYGVDAALLSKMDGRIKDFEKISPKVSEAIDARKLHTAKLNMLLAEANDLLKNEMDRLVLLLADTYIDFKKLYKNSRSIDDYRGKRSAVDAPEGFGSISGVVTDNTDSSPIEDAEVVIEGLNLSTSTDEDGEYYFEKVPAGVYAMKVSATTYKVENNANVEVISGTGIAVDFGMSSEE